MGKHEQCYLNTDPILIYPCDECNDIYVDKLALQQHEMNDHSIINSENNNFKKEIGAKLR